MPESRAPAPTTAPVSAPGDVPSRLVRCSPALVAAVAALAQWPIFDRTLSVMDEGHILMFADIVANGGELYRDATLLPLPGAFYLLALAFELFEPSILVARWIVLIEFAALCAFAFAVLRRLTSLPAAWAGPASNNARLAMPMPTTDIRFNALMR